VPENPAQHRVAEDTHRGGRLLSRKTGRRQHAALPGRLPPKYESDKVLGFGIIREQREEGVKEVTLMVLEAAVGYRVHL
jgi:hypothetical protein